MEIVKCLHARSDVFPVPPRLFASARSAGKTLPGPYGDLTIEEFVLDTVNAAKFQFVFLAVSGTFSETNAAALTNGGQTYVIDNSSAFRYDDAVPLVVPEINLDAIKPGNMLIANPNCTTAIAAMALHPIFVKFGIKTLIVSSYQATSGAGEAGMQELLKGTRAHLDGEAVVNEQFAHPIPFNCIPCIDKLQDNGYTKEEMKVVWETRKIFGAPDMKISVTAVRIPTIRAHSEAITMECDSDVTADGVRELLATAAGVVVKDDTAAGIYPMPMNASGKDDVEVGRIRQSLVFGTKGIDLFVSGDQLLRGAALNAVLIADALAKRGPTAK
jgi:aspartate-semialdehyde dehydrogenase